jgi:ubiquinone/menaquinone biosynthesis C-methylase UbiE
VLGAVGPNASILSVGAGHQPVLYWLANRVQRVVATDTYDGRWRSEGDQEGDEEVIASPATYAPFPYRRDHLAFARMDGRQLRFAPGEFDVVYSLSSIEHFGGFEEAREAMLEMRRVLRRGGILAVATEYIVSGPPCAEAFLPREIHALASIPGLKLAGPIDEQVYQRYRTIPVDLRRDIKQRPHMLVQIDDTIFTSVMLFFVRDEDVN